MMNDLSEHGFFTVAEISYLRLEAMRLFEQCLTNGDDSPLVTFIEQQIVHQPPRIQLLRDLTDDLQQRLLSLREYHFDVRERIVRTLIDTYGVDISAIAPPTKLNQYHHLTAERIISLVVESGTEVDENELLILRKTIEASLQMAAQLHTDVQLTSRLYYLVSDWLEGMNATIARQHWNSTLPALPDSENPICH
jgi:hypothetical protein